jgi:copper(I)-binding protein
VAGPLANGSRRGAAHHVLTAVAVVSAMAIVAGGCSPSRSAGNQSRTVDLGALKIRGLRVLAPPPGSSDPSGYLTLAVFNSGDSPDHFVRANVNGGQVSAAGTTTAPTGRLVWIGARQPSGIDPALRITGLQHPLKAGTTATVSLFFADAGHTSVKVPVDHFSVVVPTKSVFTPAPTTSS